LIRTGLRLVIPERHYGRIAPRSGLALKGIDVAGGVIGQCARVGFFLFAAITVGTQI
jgi:dUTP pyrophosphatase